MVGGIHYRNNEAAATSHNHTYCALYPSLHLPQLNKTIKVKAYFPVLVLKGSAVAEMLQQSPEVSLQNMHSIDHMVRKAIENFIPMTLQRLVRDICKIWQNCSVINDSLVNLGLIKRDLSRTSVKRTFVNWELQRENYGKNYGGTAETMVDSMADLDL
jgi:hypothetical protein